MYNTQVNEPNRAPVDARLQAHLGNQLRRLFSETASQPIPDRFALLLDRLEGKGAESPEADKSAEILEYEAKKAARAGAKR